MGEAKLTLARVAALCKQDIRGIKALEAPGMNLVDVDDLRCVLLDHYCPKFAALGDTHRMLSRHADACPLSGRCPRAHEGRCVGCRCGRLQC